MTKVIGPDFVALQVRDLAVAQRFYGGVLGLETDPRFTSPSFITYDTRPIPFAVREPEPGLDLDAGPDGLGVNLWLNCDDVDAVYETVAASGAPILQPPADTPFGRRFVCRDPDGYALVIYTAIPPDQVRLRP